MARGHTMPVNGTRTHAAYTAGASNLTSFTAMRSAGLCGPLMANGQPVNDGTPSDDEKRHAVGLSNESSSVVAYLYHENNAADAVLYGTPIPVSFGREIVCSDKTPCYLFTAASTAKIRVRRIGD